jgi:hypothetical protein
MRQYKRSDIVGFLFLGLAAVIIIVVASSSIQDRSLQNGAVSGRLNGLSPSGSSNSATVYRPGAQTQEYQIKEKEILIATIAAITRTAYITPVIPPTGTREDERVKPSGVKLGLDALNGWFGIVDGNRVSIYAGALLEETDQGAIVILISLPYRNFDVLILTPTRHGGVRVISEQNNRLTLLAVDGEIYYFDIPARRFVTSLTEIVMTATPPPTYTPYATEPSAQVPTFNPYPMPTGSSTEAP